MSIVAIVGDCTTTTALALAAGWPSEHDAVVLEADRTGGSLAAWLGTPASPSLSTIVANSAALGNSPSTAWTSVTTMVRDAPSGTRFIAAPVRSRAASRALSEAGSTLFPLLAQLIEPTIIADIGSYAVADAPPVLFSLASSIVVCHRQDAASAGAATVRLERLAELVQFLTAFGVPLTVALIGNRPFDPDEVGRFLTAGGPAEIVMHPLPVDDLTAAVFAGRTGVSERRLARLPLIREASALARQVASADAVPNSGRIDQHGPSR
jgi:hypothetical protein